ncbi:hypothetical protein [Fructobacillus ficulneus]|uniref:DNA replication protein n=1 Tax=Fructobacillus ficulneus TaxID=157463 RepID=A0A0K8MHB1_9LACO|nr:hypothetical protein [Fructobacillus ficulneus]GAO99857.1 DNA replication protein [Fructobacillus ficulneus]
MAQRRMLSKKVTDTDIFLEMPLSAQALYFHLNMHADDDGFISNVKTIQRMVGSSEDDRKLLEAKQFILPFDSGVVVIKDWRIHNYIQKDRYNKTIYTSEREQLAIDENGSYTKCIQVVDGMETQVRLGKDRLGKDRLGNSNTTIPLKGNDIPPKKPASKKLSKDLEQEKADFEALWKLYPRKEGKKPAFKHYQKAIKDGVTNNQIQDGIIAYSKTVANTEKSYIKQGETFFSKRSWDDDYSVAGGEDQERLKSAYGDWDF